MTEFSDSFYARVTRRTLLKMAGVGAVTIGAGSLIEACDLGVKGSSTGSAGKITIGYVSPQTGALAGFATGDNYVINGIKASGPYKSGFKVGGKTYDVEIVVKDTQSDPNRASQVARDLILTNNADIVLSASTPETTNPVADICEANGVPNVATIVPWESWYFGRGAKPGQAFNYTTMFFFGLNEFAGCFFPMWDRMSTNKLVAEMYPNDADGNAFRGNFEPLITKYGYKNLDGGAYADLTTDYTSMIAKFKSSDAQIYSNCPLPPDFNTFWKQAVQQGYKPKLATVAKVLLFPADTTALGDLVVNIATDCWWSPFHPYTSTLTGQTAKQLADGFEAATGQQWLSSLGSVHSLFEIAHKAFTAVDDPHNKKDVAGQLKSLSYTGISGPLDWTKGPMPGVAIQQPVGVQWKKGTKFPYSMQVVDNSLNKAVPINGDLIATNA